MVYNQTVCNENATWFWRGAGEEHVSKEKKKNDEQTYSNYQMRYGKGLKSRKLRWKWKFPLTIQIFYLKVQDSEKNVEFSYVANKTKISSRLLFMRDAAFYSEWSRPFYLCPDFY